MRCFSCGSEWKASPRFSEQTVCPFCGISLAAASPDTELTAEQAVKEIFRGYGSDIILQKERFLGLFSDFAPKLVQEKKLLTYALNENIAKFFIKCEESERPDVLKRVRYILSEMMNDASVDKIIGIFTEAFEWNSAPSAENEGGDITSSQELFALRAKLYYQLLHIYIKKSKEAISETQKSVADSSKKTASKTKTPKKTPAKSESVSTTQTTKKTPAKSKNAPQTQTTKKTPAKSVPSPQPSPKPVPAPPVEKYVTVRKINDFTYTGEVNAKGQPHGKGRAAYQNGEVYDGEWRGGKRWGNGKLIYKNGDYYEGGWTKDIPYGSGTSKHSGNIFSGTWRGYTKGKGSIHYTADNRYYYGEWDNYKRCGQGKMSYSDNNIKYSYEGEWKDDKLSGYGMYEYSGYDTGIEYGYNKITGYMRHYSYTYAGTFKDGKLTKGKLKYVYDKAITIYDGEWDTSQLVQKKGKGKITYPNGNVYEGEWDDLKPHGQGTMHYPNGKTKTGEWKNGSFCFFKNLFNRS